MELLVFDSNITAFCKYKSSSGYVTLKQTKL